MIISTMDPLDWSRSLRVYDQWVINGPDRYRSVYGTSAEVIPTYHEWNIEQSNYQVPWSARILPPIL